MKRIAETFSSAINKAEALGDIVLARLVITAFDGGDITISITGTASGPPHFRFHGSLSFDIELGVVRWRGEPAKLDIGALLLAADAQNPRGWEPAAAIYDLANADKEWTEVESLIRGASASREIADAIRDWSFSLED